MKFEKKWAAAALVVAVVALPLLVRGCRGDSAKQVELVAVESRAITPTILAPGTLAYRNEVNLTSEITGRVRSEERRVGKACRSRRAQSREKNKNEKWLVAYAQH